MDAMTFCQLFMNAQFQEPYIIHIVSPYSLSSIKEEEGLHISSPQTDSETKGQHCPGLDLLSKVRVLKLCLCLTQSSKFVL